MIKLFYDTETTGVNYKMHSIHQIAGIIEVNGKVDKTFSLNMRPHPKAKIEPEALKVAGVTKEQIMAYPAFDVAFKQFKVILGDYVDPFNLKDKMHLVGFNNRGFDDFFLRVWFELNGDQFIGSWFWNDTLDVLVLASQYLLERRADMPSFKLKRVAQELGVSVDESRLHEAGYDVYLTRECYKIVTGLEVEI
jgi:DNA polymerase-3 subunit epsilon